MSPHRPALVVPAAATWLRLVVLSLVATAMVAVFPLAAPPADALTGSVSGRVFRDFDFDGTNDTATSAASPAVDVGLAGVTVRAYGDAGTVIGTATTAAGGTWSINYADNGSTVTNRVRIEFDTPNGFVPTRAGGGGSNGTSVQFVANGATNVNYAVARASDYSEANPRLAYARQVGVVNSNGDALPQTTRTIETSLYTDEAFFYR